MPKQPANHEFCKQGERLRVIVLGAGERPRVETESARLRALIQQYAEIVHWDLSFSTDLTGIEADLTIVLGGDGSILRAAGQMGENQRPVIGVNLGKLGFLADLSPEELPQALPALIEGRCRIIEHLMLQCSLIRGQELLHETVGLNEVLVRGGAPFTLLDLDLYVDAELVTSYSCDGLIISTPVGSTAHSLSAGGPILQKELQALVISPLSPHALTNRPVVDSADRLYEVVVAQPNDGTAVVVDGRILGKLEPGDRICVRRAPASFRMVEVPGHSYYRTLREKLGWSGNLHLRKD